jgi:hypothetical protein
VTRKTKVRYYLAMDDGDYHKLQAEISRSTARSAAEFIRNKLLDRPLIFKVRNASADELTEQICQLKESLKKAIYLFERAVTNIKMQQGKMPVEQLLIHLELEKRMLTRQISEIHQFVVEIVDRYGSDYEEHKEFKEGSALQ